MSERLRRLEIHFDRNPIWFVTTCTHERKALLANPKIHSSLLAFAEKGPSFGAWLGAFVIMPDHVHAFVALDEQKTSLPVWVKSLKNTLSKNLRERGAVAPHWQKGFFDHVLRSDESYAEKWHYVRENPVRANLVADSVNWPFQGEPWRLDYRKDRVMR